MSNLADIPTMPMKPLGEVVFRRTLYQPHLFVIERPLRHVYCLVDGKRPLKRISTMLSRRDVVLKCLYALLEAGWIEVVR